MSEPVYKQPIPDVPGALRLLLEERPVLWVGAGASIAAGYPTMDDLVREMKKRAKPEGGIPDGLSFTQVADHYVFTRGQDALTQLLEDLMGRARPVTQLHESIARLAAAGHFQAIITTNYDRLVERALEDAKVPHLVQAPDRNDDIRWPALRVYKLHGSQEEWKHAILSGQSYADLEKRYAFLRGQFDLLLRLHPVLFAGCSMTDPVIFDWLADASSEWAESLKPWRPMLRRKAWDEAVAASKAHGKHPLARGNIRPLLLERDEELAALFEAAANTWSRFKSGAITLAGYRSDTPDGQDLLGIAEDVDALSSVVAARSVSPPLSIGLFGDWGTGKTFFMNRMRERIKQLATGSSKAKDETGQHVFVGTLVQIHFNAWHYADDSLWATLTTSIFEALARQGVDSNAPQLIDQLKEQLPSARLAEQSAYADSFQATAKRQLAESFVSYVRNRREELERELSEDSDLLKTIPEEDRKRLAKRLRRLLPGSSLPDAINAATILECDEKLAPLRGHWGTVRWWWRQGGARRALLVGAAASPLVGGALHRVLPLLGDIQVSPTLQALALIVPGLFAAQWGRVKHALGSLAKARETIEKKDREGDQERIRVIEACRQTEAEATARLERARKCTEDLEDRIKGEEPGEKLRRFVAERDRDERYRSRLGIMSLIRSDFERLSELLKNARDATGKKMTPVDRIVLYIDDLDRCPEERVVEVLEAVHLLLAFPLFVVVVGVDSRWLLHALRKHYPAFAEKEAASPQAYLEKIFQIPFTLRPMDQQGFRDLIAAQFADAPIVTVPVESTFVAGGIPRQQVVDQPAGGPSEQQPAGASAEAVPAPSPAAPEAETRAKQMRLTEGELRLMGHLSEFVPSPRAAKRLANCYRLLRVRVPQRHWEAFLGTAGQPGEYELALVLLAVLTGFPDAFASLVAALPEAKEPDWISFWTALSQRWGDKAAVVQAMKKLPGAYQDSLKAMPIERVGYWARIVARFSFHLREATAPTAEHSSGASVVPAVTANLASAAREPLPQSPPADAGQPRADRD